MQVSMSENVSELFGALAKAQGCIQPASKDKSNPFFKSKYADLTSVWDACREALSENGLSVVQFPHTKEQGTFLVSILGHSSGQWIRSEVLIPLVKNDPQSMGSAITYFRRYCLSSLVGVSPEDDDGEKAQSGFREQRRAPTTEFPPELITSQKKALLEAVGGKSETDNVTEYFKSLNKVYKKPIDDLVMQYQDPEKFATDFNLWKEAQINKPKKVTSVAD